MTDVPPKKVEIPERQYVVLSKNVVWGKVGELITLRLTDNQELSLLQSGSIKKAPGPNPLLPPKEGKTNV